MAIVVPSTFATSLAERGVEHSSELHAAILRDVSRNALLADYIQVRTERTRG